MESQMTPQPASMDVSKRTVLVLLVITVIVSALGVWTVLDSMEYAQPSGASSVQGQVTFRVLGYETPEQPSEPAASP